MYADDTTVCASAITPDGLNAIFNKELDTVEKWICQTKLILNIAKTNPLYLAQIILSRDGKRLTQKDLNKLQNTGAEYCR